VLVNEREIILVMEYLHGESLLALYHASREQGTTMPLPIAASILVSVLHGLDAAHEARSETGEPLCMVHRDVSPHNVLVGLDGAVRVLDFGLAKAIHARSDTRPGTLRGKRSYMAPEMLGGGIVTRQADIFSAGVVLWELVTGKKLFTGVSEQERMFKILSGKYPPPSSMAHDVPAAVDRIVMTALHPDVACRYQTALEMAVEIETHLAPASQRIVGEWVHEWASPALDRRAVLLHQIETSRTHSVPPIQAPDTSGEPVSNRSAADDGFAGAHSVLAGALAAVALVMWAAALVRLRSTQTIPTTLMTATAALAAATVAPAPLPSPTCAVVDDTKALNRPLRPAPAASPRHTSTRSPGNAKHFLPDDL
jgi:serine/threonine-protein kinase